MAIAIRTLQTLEELAECERLQRKVWGMSDDLDVVPLHLLLSVRDGGGLLLGAFDGAQLVGFVFGFLGLTDTGALKHCSHMMGVDPDYQSGGLGYRLKLAQRDSALGQGHTLVTWTYDPLESRNANLNIAKLGAVCRVYKRDLYGHMSDGLNAGLPSDRLLVSWEIASEHVRRRIARLAVPDYAHAPLANACERTESGFLTPGAAGMIGEVEWIRFEVPPDYQQIKTADSQLALDWRLRVRVEFEARFSAGYSIEDFVSVRSDGFRRCFYVLHRG